MVCAVWVVIIKTPSFRLNTASNLLKNVYVIDETFIKCFPFFVGAIMFTWNIVHTYRLSPPTMVPGVLRTRLKEKSEIFESLNTADKKKEKLFP